MNHRVNHRVDHRVDHGDRGAVTAELALALPLLLAVAAALVWMLTLATGQVRVVDGAREAARALARGDPEGVAVARAQRVAGPGSEVVAAYGGGEVTVTVRRRVSGPGGPIAVLPSVLLDAEAVAATESR